jgi:glycosyltransferase involved in cell wall biosynthesis
MKVLFIHPPPGQSPSGGHVFNRHLIAEAERQGFPLEAWPVVPGEPVAGPFEPGVVVLWDSLFLEALAEASPAGAVHGLLVHYLPFLNPLLSVEERRWWERRFDQAVAGLRFLLATARGAASLLERRYPSLPVYVCEPGVDPVFPAARRASPDPVDDGKVRIATVANLLPAKGQLELLEMLAALEHLNWEWHLAGDESLDPDYARRFLRRAEQLGLTERIVRHGILAAPELAWLLARMDLFAFPSRYEAYGMALAEAVAAGLPIIATAVGEAERLVRHGETGFVVPVEEGEGFRAGLARLVADEVLRRRFREKLRKEPRREWKKAFAEFRDRLRAISKGVGNQTDGGRIYE